MELEEDEEDRLVKAVQRDERRAVRAVAPVDEQQAGEEAEACHVVVRGAGSLPALAPHDPHPDVCHLDHRHVVAAVADG